MDIDQLESELENWDIDPQNINLNGPAVYDGCFNLIRCKDGKWEIFYGSLGKKTLHSIFDSEEQACLAFIKLLQENKNTEKLADKPKYWKGYQRYASSFQVYCVIGILVVGLLIGLAGAGYQIYTREINFMFWIFVVWTISYGAIIFFYCHERLYEIFEHLAEPVIYFSIMMFCAACTFLVPFFNIPNIMASETPVYDTVCLILIEPLFPLGAWGTYRFLLKEYVDELKEYIRSKKNDADDESGSTYDKEYEKELKSMRKKSSIE